MNVIAGRGGLLTTFLGLFMYLIMACLYVLWFEFLVFVGIIIYTSRAIRWLYRHHKGKQAAVQQATSLAAPPMPVMSRVGGPRDWTPGNTR